MLTFQESTPEASGVPSTSILRFIERLEADKVPMHSFLFLHQDCLIAEGYYAPYKKDTLHRMFSISKSFTSIAIGLLEEDGLVHLSDPICNYFPEYVNEQTHPWILAMTIEDMLMMRTCHASTTYKLDMTSDWVESFFTATPTHPSGKVFHYDTSSAHTLCALVEKLTGMELLAYIKKKLAPLGFSEASYMLKDPFDVSLGGSGLVATPMDLLKFGYFIVKEGNIAGTQLLNASYIRKATANLTPTKATAPLPSEAMGYGYQFWQNEKGGAVCYGMGGQFIIFLPDYDFICVTTANTQGMAGGNQLIYNALYEEVLPHIQKSPLPDNANLQAELSSRIKQLELKPLTGAIHSNCMAKISGNVYTLLPNEQGFSKLSVSFDEVDSAILHYTLNDVDYELSFGFGKLKEGIFPVYDMKYAASAEWLSNDILYIYVHVIDAYLGSVQFELSFGDHDVTVFLKKVEESLFHEFNGHLYGTTTN